MIVCSVKDLLVIVLKKFYFIILGALLFVMLAIFSAQVSYQAASDNYNAYVEDEENEESSGTCVWFIRCVSKTHGENQANIAAVQFVDSLLKDNNLRKEIGLSNELAVQILEGSNLILLRGQTLNSTEMEEQIEIIKKILRMAMIEEDIEVEYGKESFGVQESFAKKIMKKPSENIQKLKVCIRGGVLGILASVFLILVIEYVKSNKKADCEQGKIHEKNTYNECVQAIQKLEV